MVFISRIRLHTSIGTVVTSPDDRMIEYNLSAINLPFSRLIDIAVLSGINMVPVNAQLCYCASYVSRERIRTARMELVRFSGALKLLRTKIAIYRQLLPKCIEV